VGTTRSEAAPSSLERCAFSVAEFCHRNSISLPTYRRLRSQGRAPVEMRLGLNLVRITGEAERNWQRQMQEPQPDLEARASERAAKAGDAAAKSNRHISKQSLKRSPKRRT